MNAERIITTVLRTVRAHYANHLGRDLKITPETKLADDLDLLDIDQIITEIERVTDLSVHGTEIPTPGTVADIILATWRSYLSKEIAASAALIYQGE